MKLALLMYLMTKTTKRVNYLKQYFSPKTMTAYLKFTAHVVYENRNIEREIVEEKVFIPLESAEELAAMIDCYNEQDWNTLFSESDFYSEDVEWVEFDGLIIDAASEQVNVSLGFTHRLHGSASVINL